MLAVGKTSLLTHLRGNARVSASLGTMGTTSVRSLLVPTTAPENRKGQAVLPVMPTTKRLLSTSAVRPIRKVPTLEMAKAVPASYSEMNNDQLVTLGALNIYKARREILRRHIMAFDNVEYEEAGITLQKIIEQNKQGMFLMSLPYQIGITAGLSAGLLSIPLVFHLPTAEWFNMYYVTTDVPEPADLETALEVGAWTWNWMEPPLGAMSFFLLCLQFSRAQITNLGVKPYTGKIKELRGKRLVKAFPQYDRGILMEFSTSAIIYGQEE